MIRQRHKSLNDSATQRTGGFTAAGSPRTGGFTAAGSPRTGGFTAAGHRSRIDWTRHAVLFVGLAVSSLLFLHGMPNSPLRAGVRKPNSLAGRAELAVTANAPSQFALQAASNSADAANLITLGGETYRAKMKNIEDVRPGDKVLSQDPETGELAAKRVERNFERVTDHLRILRIRNADGTEQTIETTNEHPFWVPSSGWVNAGDLQVSQRVKQSDGSLAVVASTTYEPHPEGIPVYNFEVAAFHTYYVAASTRAPPVLVHNANCGFAPKAAVPSVTDPKLKNYVDNLYKGAKGPNPIGTGSTADAVRNELLTGLPTHGRFHSQKAQETINGLTNWLRKNPNASHHDRLVAQSLIDDLKAALGGN
jgi:hypothetical protein